MEELFGAVFQFFGAVLQATLKNPQPMHNLLQLRQNRSMRERFDQLQQQVSQQALQSPAAQQAERDAGVARSAYEAKLAAWYVQPGDHQIEQAAWNARAVYEAKLAAWYVTFGCTANPDAELKRCEQAQLAGHEERQAKKAASWAEDARRQAVREAAVQASQQRVRDEAARAAEYARRERERAGEVMHQATMAGWERGLAAQAKRERAS